MKVKGREFDGIKPRLFVDMDGTLAEWRNISINIDSSEESTQDLLQEKLKKLDEILYMPGYFRTLKPHYNVVEAIRNIVLEGQYEVYVLSCCRESKGDRSPEAEKNAWLNDYLPEIDSDHRIFVPDGQDKTEYIPGGIQENDFLLDDYTKNLKDWEKAVAKENRAIKLLNNVNESKGEWRGNCVSYDRSSFQIFNSINAIIQGLINIVHDSPEKDKKSISHKDFISRYKTNSLSNNVIVFHTDEPVPYKLLKKVFEKNWKEKIFYNKDDGYRILFENNEELMQELIDMESGRSQKVIPDDIVEQVLDYINTEVEYKQPDRSLEKL